MVVSCKGLIHLTSGRNVLITGASRGLGEAIAREFSRAGANLILVARGGERLTALAEELASRRTFFLEQLLLGPFDSGRFL